MLMRRFERLALREGTRSPGPWRRLLALVGRPRAPIIVRVHRRRPVPACSRLAESEGQYIAIALRFADDSQFERAYRKSQGLCVPHALRVLDMGVGSAAARALLTRTLSKWAELRRDLSGFVGKHDYRNRESFTEAEGSAHLRAIETLIGTPGLFANDMCRERAGPAPPGSDHAARSAGLGGGGRHVRARQARGEDQGADRAAAATRAAARPRSTTVLAQVAEDRTLESGSPRDARPTSSPAGHRGAAPLRSSDSGEPAVRWVTPLRDRHWIRSDGDLFVALAVSGCQSLAARPCVAERCEGRFVVACVVSSSAVSRP